VLIVFNSFDGQTARVAERIGARLKRAGHNVTVRSSEALEGLWELDTHDAILIGGAIRFGKHARHLVELVRDHLQDLALRPTAFFSVCKSAGGPGARPDAAQRYIDEFLRRTGWKPTTTRSFAGALRYTRYNFFVRTMIRLIMTVVGGDTDASRDYEYTDWDAVDAFADEFAAMITKVPAKAA
jgi:menaquinone-dependent protoporphyrinogen oxidase